ncbi:hypothetical protein ACWC3X_36380 [Streptomyces populi]
MVESWNSANTVLHYGKDGALTGPDKEHAETSIFPSDGVRAAPVPLPHEVVSAAPAPVLPELVDVDT